MPKSLYKWDAKICIGFTVWRTLHGNDKDKLIKRAERRCDTWNKGAEFSYQRMRYYIEEVN